MFVIAPDPTPQRNGDIAIRSDKGRLVALVYAMGVTTDTRRYAELIVSALNAALSPSMTDLMVDPSVIESIDYAGVLSEDGT